ncbi:MAG: hypothetical protein R3B06_09505 [Kofleriaceae bacterium]
MRRRGLVGLALAGLASCHATPAATPTVANRGTPAPAAGATDGQRDGALWTCQIEDYAPQPCRLDRVDTGWRLTKLIGSQRFRGSVEFAADRLHFVGEFYCPWGACDQALDEWFQADGRAGYQWPGEAAAAGGGPATIQIRYDRALDEAFGGAGYGRLTGDER